MPDQKFFQDSILLPSAELAPKDKRTFSCKRRRSLSYEPTTAPHEEGTVHTDKLICRSFLQEKHTGLRDKGQKLLDLSSPEPGAVLEFAATYVYEKLFSHDYDSCPPEYSAFDETRCLVDSGKIQTVSQNLIQSFLSKIQQVGSVAPTAIIIGLHFATKLKAEHPRLPFNRLTWKRILFGALILASKVYEDTGVCLQDFCHFPSFPFMNLRSFNRLEIAFLACLDYNISWKMKDYNYILLQL